MKEKSIMRLNNLKIKLFLFVPLCLLLTTACGNKQTTSAEENQEIIELRELVDHRNFEIENQWADPLGGRNINLVGNANFIRFEKDTVDVFLPYFGERQIGGSYGGRENAGITYKGPAKNLDIKEDEKKIVIEFEGKEGNEDFRFRIKLFPTGKTTTSVNSSHRDAIAYRGQVREMEEE